MTFRPLRMVRQYGRDIRLEQGGAFSRNDLSAVTDGETYIATGDADCERVSQ